jgi:hypothetical protein
MLTDPQIDRYARHILLREVGGVGQERLLRASVRVDGLGPAGQWLVSWLALAGVGRIVLADRAPVTRADVAPLLRTADVGLPRDAALVAALPAFNSDVAVSADGAVADLRIDTSAGHDVTALRILARGGDVAVFPPGTTACAACLAQLAEGPPTATAAARAGSVGGAEALLLLLGRGGRGAQLFVSGEPLRCTHST